MDEEPQERVPVPSPHPSTGLEVSGELELTPERPARRREPRRPAQLRQHDIEGENKLVVQTKARSELAAPRLNTTTPLYLQLQQQKLSKGRKGREGPVPSKGVRKGLSLLQDTDEAPHVSPSSTVLSSTTNESRTVTSRPEMAQLPSTAIAKEVNVPLHEARYSELVGVDVSEESFQQLTTRPRTKPSVATGRRRGKGGSKGVGGRECQSTGPNIMDLYSSDLEFEDIDIRTPAVNNHTHLEPVLPSPDSALTFFHFIRSL